MPNRTAMRAVLNALVRSNGQRSVPLPVTIIFIATCAHVMDANASFHLEAA